MQEKIFLKKFLYLAVVVLLGCGCVAHCNV